MYWTIRNDDVFGDDPEERDEKLPSRRPTTIYTSLDLELQATAEPAVNENVPRSTPRFDVGAAA